MGDRRYVVTTGFEAIVLTHWSAPFTGGDEKFLPPGLEFVVAFDPPDGATALSADADPAKHWEAVLVSDDDRTAEKYGGYSICIPLDCLETNCSRR